MNEFILLKVKALILLEPDHYEQNVWDCGTTACIAGLSARIMGFRLPSLVCLDPEKLNAVQAAFDEAKVRVQKSLKLDDRKWKKLTDIRCWPTDFRQECCIKGRTSKERAITAGKRIDRFIETNGEE